MRRARDYVRVARMAARACVLAACVRPTLAAAQGVRVTGTSLATYVELQPLVEDSIADSLTTGSGGVRQSPIGTVYCVVAHTYCYFYRSRPVTHTIPLTQDIEATGWGFGEGISVYAHLRASTTAGGETELWTGESEHLNALAAYIELDRAQWTARAGRQWLTSQLGYNNFDGLSLEIRPARGLSVEGYGGLGLVQGLSVPPTSSELAQADVLPPDVRSIALGLVARWRPRPSFAVGAEYSRELRSDRAGLYSERAAVDGSYLLGATAISGDVQADLASTAIYDARLRISRPVAEQVTASIEAVHSTPFFPLWTIWGVFAPVGFNDARADARWASTTGALSFQLGGGYRQYQNTHTGVGFLPLRDNGWTLTGSGAWRLRAAWELTGSYRRDIGFGASKSDGGGGLRWIRGDASWIGITGSAVQNIYEYTVNNGYVVGGTLDTAVPITAAVHLAAQVGIYRQLAENTPATTTNWSQRRALIRLVWGAGRDPGMSVLEQAAGARR